MHFSDVIFPANVWGGISDPSERNPDAPRCLMPYTLQERG